MNVNILADKYMSVGEKLRKSVVICVISKVDFCNHAFVCIRISP